MADDDGSVQSKNVWPLVKFQFAVTIDGNTSILFQEVTGLSQETTPIEYRAAGKGQPFSVIKMPGIIKYGNITLKKGQFKGDKQLWDKLDSNNMNTTKRMPVVISLLDELGEPAMTWTLKNAWVCKVVHSDLKADANEAALETVEMAHEGCKVTVAS